MSQTNTLKPYVKLLSVYLFTVMEDGETLLSGQDRAQDSLSADFWERTHQAQDWLMALSRLDPHLTTSTIPLLTVWKNQVTGSPKIEDMTNAAALTLMLLDDHYKIFVSDRHHLATLAKPSPHLYSVESDTPAPHPC